MNSRQFFWNFFLFCNLFQEQGSSDFTRVTLTRKHLHTKEEKKKKSWFAQKQNWINQKLIFFMLVISSITKEIFVAKFEPLSV